AVRLDPAREPLAVPGTVHAARGVPDEAERHPRLEGARPGGGQPHHARGGIPGQPAMLVDPDHDQSPASYAATATWASLLARLSQARPDWRSPNCSATRAARAWLSSATPSITACRPCSSMSRLTWRRSCWWDAGMCGPPGFG